MVLGAEYVKEMFRKYLFLYKFLFGICSGNVHDISEHCDGGCGDDCRGPDVTSGHEGHPIAKAVWLRRPSGYKNRGRCA